MVSETLSCGVVVVRKESDGWRYLLLRAFQHWDFPKGLQESGEDPFDTAIREVQEETTITDLEFRWGLSYTETEPYNRGKKIARYYLGETHTSAVRLLANPLLGYPEHSEFRWMTTDEAMQKLTPRVKRILDWARKIMETEAGK